MELYLFTSWIIIPIALTFIGLTLSVFFSSVVKIAQQRHSYRAARVSVRLFKSAMVFFMLSFVTSLMMGFHDFIAYTDQILSIH